MSVKSFLFFSALHIGFGHGYFNISQKHALVKIVGGHEASIVDYPYQVSLRIYNSHICGGSLISKKYVLTAAHCVEPHKHEISYMGVGIGHTRLSDRQTIHKVESALIHPGYVPDTFPIANDIALLRLSKAVKVDNLVVKSIPLSTETPKEATLCTVSGWGSVKEPKDNEEVIIEDHLRAVDVHITGHKTCEDLTALGESVICAGEPEGGKDSCQGDSGGPLACEGRLAGIVSWGPGCGEAHAPGVYTDVSYFSEWIGNHSLASPPLSSVPFLLVPALVTVHFEKWTL